MHCGTATLNRPISKAYLIMIMTFLSNNAQRGLSTALVIEQNVEATSIQMSYGWDVAAS
jgi:hypothetical protein